MKYICLESYTKLTNPAIIIKQYKKIIYIICHKHKINKLTVPAFALTTSVPAS